MFGGLIYMSVCFYFAFISKDWRYIQIPNVAFSLFGIIALWGMPESPRFLVSAKKYTQAKEVFNLIASWNGLPANTADNFVFTKSAAEREDDTPSENVEEFRT